MAHQIFGPRETIFGYKQLAIKLYYLHNSSKCFVKIEHSGKVEHIEADDIMQKLDPWLPTNYTTSEEEFVQIVKNEKHNQMFGTVIHEFEKSAEVIAVPSRSTTCKYKITQCDLGDPLFQEYHQRFETYITWFIDGANFIDLNDERWLIFYMYEEYTHPVTGEVFITPIGFTTIYKFYSYPSGIRARISQFFILPTHQLRRLGSALYKTVFKHITQMPEIVDLTVEEPNESFQAMRDACDAVFLYDDIKENNAGLYEESETIFLEYVQQFKFCKRQAWRLTDILRYRYAYIYSKQKSFLDGLFKRMEYQIEKEFGNHKRAKLDILEQQDPQLLMAKQLEERFCAYSRVLDEIAQRFIYFRQLLSEK
ncbi:hypothetical protein WA026_011485 [Henosepilachna vigintioctopunctata]